MTEEKEDIIFRTLRFYFGEGQKIHIKIISGKDAGKFRNGFIIDVNKSRLIFADDVLGSLEYKIYEISENIAPYREGNKW